MTVMVSSANGSLSERVDLDVIVEGPDARGLTDADVRRLFPGNSPSGVRLNRLRNWPRVVVRVDDTVAAVATYTQTPVETQIPDFAIGIPSAVGPERSRLAERVLDALLDAVEVASVAGGCQRIVLIPSVASVDDMERRGYAVVRDGYAGSWMEKSLGRL